VTAPIAAPHEGQHALGEVLEQDQAGLLVVYATNIADQVASNVKAVNKYVSQKIDAQANALARQLKEAEATSSTRGARR
jgi:ubiquinone biosynthesis protein UbiJ